MKKRKSTRETKNMVQTALWLPRDTHEQLKKTGGERGLGEEIRRLIDVALDRADTAQTPDEMTGEFLDQVKEIVRDLSADQPLWASPDAFDAFKAAINVLLELYRPRSEAKPGAGADLRALYGGEKPEIIGRIIAHRAMHAYGRERHGKTILDKLKELKE